MNIFKNSMIVLAMLFSSIASLKAQDDRLDELTFEETVIQEEKVPYFGVGGGFVVSLFTPELKDVNAQLSTAGLSELTTPLTMTGAIGVATIGILPNVRISIANLGGSISTAEKEFTINQQQYLRSASLSNAYTGFGFDYAFSLAKSLYLIPGISGGWGTMEITTTQYAKGVETSNSTIGGSPNDVNVFNHSLRNNYFMVNPGLSVEFAPALLGSDKPRIITVRAHAGYALSFMGDWKENGKTIVNNVSSGIDASGLAFQLGFMIGLFN
ncbi:MAG: hypothetical protein LW818_03290 [Ignavibacteriae bacterium]|nr:hypothetical protein [Ignavibacteriota bacterium]